MTLSDQDELRAREHAFEAARTALEDALTPLESPNATSDHFAAACAAWGRFHDPTHEYVRFVNGYRLDHPTYQFREFAETCLSLYRRATGSHQALLDWLKLQSDRARFETLLATEETFLSPLVRAVVEGRPDLVPELQKAAAVGRYVLSGPNGNLPMPNAASRYLPQVIAAAGLDAYEEPEAYLAQQWGLAPSDPLVPRLRRALTDLAKIGADAARLALVDPTDDEEDALGSGAVSARRDDSTWDGAGSAEQGRRNKRASMRYTICHALGQRLGRLSRKEPVADATALAIIALSIGVRGDLVRDLCGGGGMLIALRDLRRLLDPDVWELANDIGPNAMTGAGDVERVEALLSRVRELFQRIQKTEAERRSRPVAETPNDPAGAVTNVTTAGLWKILTEAIKAVPSVRFALGVLGIIAAMGIALLFVKPVVAVIGVVVGLFLMTALVIFSGLTRQVDKHPNLLHRPAVIFIYVALFFVVVTGALVLSSFFFGFPLDWRVGYRGEQERKFAPRHINFKAMPLEVAGKLRVRAVAATEVLPGDTDSDTVSLADEFWTGLDEVNLKRGATRPSDNRIAAVLTQGRTPGIEVEIQSIEDAPDDPLRVLAGWVEAQGFRVKFVPKQTANRIYVFQRAPT